MMSVGGNLTTGDLQGGNTGFNFYQPNPAPATTAFQLSRQQDEIKSLRAIGKWDIYLNS